MRVRPVVLLALCGVLIGGCETEPTAVATPALLALETTPGARLPRLAEHPDGGVWLSWVEPLDDGGHALRLATLADGAWSTPTTVASGHDWFVNWADFPSVIPLPDGGAAAHWLARSGTSPYAYDVLVAVSDDGRRWRAPIRPHGDGTQSEHGFVSLFPDAGGVGAIWLDGRNTLATDPAAAPDGSHAGHGGAMTLRVGLIDRSGRRVSEAELDPRTCDCCQTDVALTDAGPVAVYRDRSDDEIRDIRIVARRDGRWQESRSVAEDGWRIEGCPVNGPAVAASSRRIAVAWFTAADDRPRVLVAFAADPDGDFGAPIEVDAGPVSGRVGLVLLDDGDAVVSWVATGTDDDAAQIRYRRLAADGRAGPINVVTRVDASRSAGFPQLARGADGLVFAWTTPGVPASVLTATAPLPR